MMRARACLSSLRTLRRLRRDRSGTAMLEFAFSLPIVLGLGAYGLEISNQALLQVKVSQIALNLADNASRVGVFSSLNSQQLREVDINDVLQAARYQGQSIALTTNGRIILSSLEGDSTGVQRIHWQRCLGLKSGTGYESSYGITATNGQSSGASYDVTAGVNTASSGDNSATHPGSRAVGTTANPVVGMGDTATTAVSAPANSGVMFVEINYLSKPLFGEWLTQPMRIHSIASFIVRDKRTFDQLYNPSPAITTANKLTCDRYTA